MKHVAHTRLAPSHDVERERRTHRSTDSSMVSTIETAERKARLSQSRKPSS
ncbi:hypothetical protein AKJ09_10487 [Labilithrix luteola]|uniref:Uncharacterized protein n=1 Tax=Labilithrix luteola TaxID=1391654 RepID=A0A0K1QDI5_9BACT|nr:hypothetical protein AKJ09_10487 [Labilithrix luteola]